MTDHADRMARATEMMSAGAEPSPDVALDDQEPEAAFEQPGWYDESLLEYAAPPDIGSPEWDDATPEDRLGYLEQVAEDVAARQAALEQYQAELEQDDPNRELTADEMRETALGFDNEERAEFLKEISRTLDMSDRQTMLAYMDARVEQQQDGGSAKFRALLDGLDLDADDDE